MFSRKLAKVPKVLATVILLVIFLTTSIAFASEAGDGKPEVEITFSSEKKSELKTVTLSNKAKGSSSESKPKSAASGKNTNDSSSKSESKTVALSKDTEASSDKSKPKSAALGKDTKDSSNKSEPKTVALSKDTEASSDKNKPKSAALGNDTKDSSNESDPESVTLGEETEGSSSEFELLDHFVTAERIPTSRWDTPANVSVITAKEIEDNHYQSIAEAVNHVNGVFSLIDSIALNGTDRTLILVDGRRTNVTPSMKAIERIEIVKGGGSALYGSAAVGGVINIITKKGDHNETTFDVSAGSWHTQRYDITNQGNDGKLGWFIAGNIYKSRPYNHKGASGTDDLLSDHADDNVTVRLDHRIDDRNSVTFDFMHHSKEYNQYYHDRTFNQYTQNRYYKLKDNPTVYLKPFYNVANDVAATYNFKEDGSTPGFLRFFRNYQSWFAADVIGQSNEGNEILQGLDYQNGWEFGQHKFIAGLEWHQNISNTNYRLKYGEEYRKFTNSAYYLQDTISLGHKWTLVPGARLDHNSYFGDKWSPKLAANYRSDEKTKIYASWGKVYQAPGVAELYTDKITTLEDFNIPLEYRGDSRFLPEKGHTATIGVEHDFDNKSRINFNLFTSKIYHLIDLHDYDNVRLDYSHLATSSRKYEDKVYVDYANATDYNQRGAELSFAQKIDDSWSYNVGYAYIHRGRNVGEEQLVSHFKLPENSFKAGINYKHGIWKASLLGMMGPSSYGGRYMPNDFAALDFNLSCDVTKSVTIYAKFLNFTNQGYSFYGNVDEKVKQVKHEAGRAFFVGVDCKL